MTTMQDKRLERQVKAGAATFGWKIKDERVGPVFGFGRTSLPLAGSHAEVLDQTGKRLTVTRLATLGLFAFAAKKTTGHATVLLVSPEGTLRGATKKAEEAWQFVANYNAYVSAVQEGEANPPT